MSNNDSVPDPFSNSDFWQGQLRTRTRPELETCLGNFDGFLREMEREYHFVMSPRRRAACRLTLEALLRGKRQQEKNERQGDLFDG